MYNIATGNMCTIAGYFSKNLFDKDNRRGATIGSFGNCKLWHYTCPQTTEHIVWQYSSMHARKGTLQYFVHTATNNLEDGSFALCISILIS